MAKKPGRRKGGSSTPSKAAGRNAKKRAPVAGRPAGPRTPDPVPAPEREREREGGAPGEPAPPVLVADADGDADLATDALAEQTPSDVFPIVGIGSSAGGLEALEQFLRNVPARCGMAFVIVQHLDPADRGAFIEILQRSTSMPVAQARDDQQVEVDHVYVIPPGKDLSLLHGRLHVLPQSAPRGLNLPVDVFFRSLAEDRRERGMAVVLSGMGTDGTLGLRSIKEKGGATFVQALTSAKFDGMPRSAVDAGLADVVAPASDLPKRLLAFYRHTEYAALSAPALEEGHQSALAKVFILLRTQTGNDFSLYKRSTVYRRIERRMGLHQIDKIGDYVRFLRENAGEVTLLFRELLIGVTSFFRDPASWDHLKTAVVPELLAAHPHGGTLRAWVPGCSTGEEAYSLAMVLKEVLEERKDAPPLTVQIFATDLDQQAIDKARQGAYPANIAADVTPERLRRFFVKDEHGYRVNKDIRETVVFAPQNIIMDPPFTKLDLLSCRNLLIYLSPEVQKKLIPLFHYSLNPSGVLFLGSAETIGSFGGLFAAVDGKTRIYRRLDDAVGQAPIDILSSYRAPAPPVSEHPPEAAEEGRPGRTNLQVLADRVIVQRFAPTAVVTNDKGDILYTSGRTGKYLEPAVGRASMNVFAMARDGLRYELSAAFGAATKEDRPVTVRGVRVGTNGGTQVLDLTVQRLQQPRELRGSVIIVFTEVAAPPQAEAAASRRGVTGARVAELTTELERAHEELQSTREEMQTSQEELKSMNEELQSTNEELQSTNEELTTSKEEMQSMNEELQTVNHELQSKVEELSRSNNDMKNLLNSTDIATLFLDGELLVRRFTAPTSKLIKLIPGDTGRPITDIASELQYAELADDAREVLRTLVFAERQVSTRQGRWFNVRILPYRTVANVIDGVVITFSDVTETKALEERLREEARDFRQLADALPALAWRSRPDGACDFLSRSWQDFTGVPESEHLGFGWLEQVHPDDRERVREAWRVAVRTETPLDLELRLRVQNGAGRWFKTRAVPNRNQRGEVVCWYGTHTDVDELKRGVSTGADHRGGDSRPGQAPTPRPDDGPGGEQS